MCKRRKMKWQKRCCCGSGVVLWMVKEVEGGDKVGDQPARVTTQCDPQYKGLQGG
jgi:hypothetical protein